MQRKVANKKKGG